MSYDPHDVDQVSERKTRRKAKATHEQIDLQRICADPSGRRVLARILAATGYMHASYVPGDPLATAYREGMRSIGIDLHAALTNAGDDFARVILAENVHGDD
ncbi:hypothetical protein JRX38_14200 [Gluconobacter cerinus]|uniref:Bbp19 family protein n=1 Tax=Gluconobacter cerinus TaxID=38307 RepID=UPI00193EF593|nr:hypothetical protein [Gluconobacter cerinus]MBM3099139.1 hypothetical protein [Gluconobacter cerinus]